MGVEHSMDVLNDADRTELRELASLWKSAHLAGDFAAADKARSKLIAWGAWPPEKGWWASLESTEHYRERVKSREQNAN
mgnify:CR=1 FL=1